MKVFLFDKNQERVVLILNYLYKKSLDVTAYNNYKIAKDNIFNQYNLFIIGISNKNCKGFELLKEIKRINTNFIAYLYSEDLDLDLIKNAYSLKCDDFLDYNNLNLEKLAIRISSQISSKIIEIKSKKLTFDNVTKIITINKKNIILTRAEFRVFELLINNINKTMSYDQIYIYVNGQKNNMCFDKFYNTSCIRTLIYRLKKKLEVKDLIISDRVLSGYRINSDNQALQD